MTIAPYGLCMKYFDSHIHFFPDALAEKALSRLADVCKCSYHADGTREGTLKKQEQWAEETGYEFLGAMLFSIATNAKQQTSVNNFAAQSQTGKLRCFGSVYPAAENALEELHRIKDLGLHGIKFHPDYQEFFVGDETLLPVFAEAERLGLPVSFHTGRDPYSPDLVHCPPDVLAKIADQFPKLTIIAAHMGGMDMPQEAAKYLAGKKNVYFDTAFASRFLDPEAFTELALLHGPERILFATDCPWSTVPNELELLNRSGLTDAQREKILWRNAAELFDL